MRQHCVRSKSKRIHSAPISVAGWWWIETALVVAALLGGVCSGARMRGEVGLPGEVGGYQVLKCDFHMHTFFRVRSGYNGEE